MSPLYTSAIISLWVSGKIRDYEIPIMEGYLDKEPDPSSYWEFCNKVRSAYRDATGGGSLDGN